MRQLAEEKYDLPTFIVLINILKESNAAIPDRYESNCEGLYARQDYRVINLWEVEVEVVFAQTFTIAASVCASIQGW